MEYHFLVSIDLNLKCIDHTSCSPSFSYLMLSMLKLDQLIDCYIHTNNILMKDMLINYELDFANCLVVPHEPIY